MSPGELSTQLCAGAHEILPKRVSAAELRAEATELVLGLLRLHRELQRIGNPEVSQRRHLGEGLALDPLERCVHRMLLCSKCLVYSLRYRLSALC